MRGARAFVVWLAVIVGACSGGGPSGPEEQDANIGGTWTYAATNLASGGFTCNASLTLSLTQSSGTFHGSYFGTLTCFGGGDQITEPVQGQVTGGTVNGNGIAFNIDTSDFHHTGSVSGGSMSGTATMRLVLEGEQFTLTGPWSASRT